MSTDKYEFQKVLDIQCGHSVQKNTTLYLEVLKEDGGWGKKEKKKSILSLKINSKKNKITSESLGSHFYNGLKSH